MKFCVELLITSFCFRSGLWHGDNLGDRVCVLQHHHHLDHLLPVSFIPSRTAMEYLRQ